MLLFLQAALYVVVTAGVFNGKVIILSLASYQIFVSPFWQVMLPENAAVLPAQSWLGDKLTLVGALGIGKTVTTTNDVAVQPVVAVTLTENETWDCIGEFIVTEGETAEDENPLLPCQE